MNSIRKTLLLWLLGGIAFGIALVTWLIYTQARSEANALFDYQMKQMAAALPGRAFSPISPEKLLENDEDIVIQIWDSTGVRIYGSHSVQDLPRWAAFGFTNVKTRDGDWRVYSDALGETVVQIAQPLRVRRVIAARIAFNTVAPLLLLLPALGVLIWIAVGRGLKSLRRVAAEVRQRGSHALAPIPERNLPEEVSPLVHALNDLLGRLDHALTAQRDFVADAAHELRTPLTALQLQVQLAERAPNEAARSAAFTDLKAGLARAHHLVAQLLTLARQEPGAFPAEHAALRLDALAQSVVADFALLASERGIDLGIAHVDEVTLNGHADTLRILLGNLIDNALRYTPAGGHIDVIVRRLESGCELVVADTGPGIPQEELPRVLDRFYRVAGTQTRGSGLGLAIVERIAQAHEAHLMLENRSVGGLQARVFFTGASVL